MRDSIGARLRNINKSGAGNYALRLACGEAADRIESLESELAVALADAQRYRWLRSEFKRHDAMATVMLRHSLSRNDGWVNIAGALDDAIDAAMREEKP
jgi:hypothetical protein